MSKILIITNDFPPRNGGIETFAYEILKRFNPEDIIVLSSHSKNDYKWDKKQKFKIVRHSKILLPTNKTFKIISKIVRENDIKKVWFVSSVPLGLLTKKLKKIGVQKIVATSHGHETWWNKIPVTRQLLGFVIKNVDIFTYISNHTKKSLIRKDFAEKYKVLRPAVDEEYFVPKSPVNTIVKKYNLQNKNVILCVGRLVKRKGQAELIKSMPEILKKFPDAYLLIVGSGPMENKLKKNITELNLQNNIKIDTNFSFSDSLPDLYSIADIFCMPCKTIHFGLEEEGLGIVYLEAAAMAKPVIAGTSGGAPETVENNKTGFITKTEINEIASKIIYLLDNPDRAKEMGRLGRTRIENDWTWNQSYLRLVEYFKND